MTCDALGLYIRLLLFLCWLGSSAESLRFTEDCLREDGMVRTLADEAIFFFQLRQVDLHDLEILTRSRVGRFLDRPITVGFGDDPPPADLERLLSAASRSRSLNELILATRVVLTAEDLSKVAAIPNLRSLDISNTRVDRDAAMRLSTARNLRRLRADGVELPPELLRALAERCKLEMVSLRASNIGNEHLAALSNCGRLSILEVDRSHITNEGLQSLVECRQLEILNIGNSPVTSLPDRLPVEKLSVFLASSSELTDDGILRLADAVSLEDIDLGYTNITNKSCNTLKKLTKLKTLVLHHTHMDQAGVDSLRRALPNCRVYSDFDQD